MPYIEDLLKETIALLSVSVQQFRPGKPAEFWTCTACGKIHVVWDPAELPQMSGRPCCKQCNRFDFTKKPIAGTMDPTTAKEPPQVITPAPASAPTQTPPPVAPPVPPAPQPSWYVCLSCGEYKSYESIPPACCATPNWSVCPDGKNAKGQSTKIKNRNAKAAVPPAPPAPPATPAVPAPPQPPMPPAPPPPPPPAPPAPPTQPAGPDIASIRVKLAEIVKIYGTKAVEDAVKAFGAECLTEVPVEKLPLLDKWASDALAQIQK